MNEIEDFINDYSPYCSECGACGESGCCPAYMCTMDDRCDYKQTYLREFRERYSLVEEFYEKIYDKLPQDLKEEWDKIENTNWEFWHGRDKK